MKTFLTSFVLLFTLLTCTPEAEAGRGCCSGHGGDCGCKTSGKMSCCDGSESPSCKCSGNSQSSQKPTKTPKPKIENQD